MSDAAILKCRTDCQLKEDLSLLQPSTNQCTDTKNAKTNKREIADLRFLLFMLHQSVEKKKWQKTGDGKGKMQLIGAIQGR